MSIEGYYDGRRNTFMLSILIGNKVAGRNGTVYLDLEP